MKTFIQYLMEMPYRKIDKLNPTQRYTDHDVDRGWIEYLRGHVNSGLTSKEYIKRNPTFKLTTTSGKTITRKVDPKRLLSEPIRVERSKTQWTREPDDKEDEMDIKDGHHRFYARKLEGKKWIKTNI